MISYWSSHACPAINYFKSHLLRHFHYLIEISLVLIWLLYVLPLDVGLRFNPFLILAIHCNRRRETLSTPKYSLINSKTGLLFLEFNCLSHRCKLCTDGRVIVESADKGKTWHVTIRLFVRVAHFELVVLYCSSKVLGVVQSTKCFVLKWETSVGFPPTLSEVFYTLIQILSTSSFASLNATFFADVLFSRISKAS